MSLDSILANIAFGAFLAAAAVQIFFLFRKAAKPDVIGPWLLLASAILLLAVLVLRSFEVGFVALTSTYESLALPEKASI
jgi:hypothetical protein